LGASSSARSEGRLIDLIHILDRPTSLAFGGSDDKTLDKGARGALYSMRVE